MFLPLFMGLGGQEIIIIAVIVVLLFGAKKIPELMKGVGKGVKSFKEGISGIGEEIDGTASKTENKDKQ